MTDRSRRLIYAAGSILIAVIIIITVVLATRSTGSDSAGEALTLSPSPTSSATLSSEQSATVREAVLTAARFNPDRDGSESARRQSYQQAGFSPELIASFTPIWIDVLPLGNSDYAPEPELVGLIAAKGAKVTGVERTDVDGRSSLRVTLQVTQSFSYGGYGDDPDYRLEVDNGFEATWTATLDEETNQITAIEQPAVSDLPEPLQKVRAASLRHLYKG
ncbi:hypothetical protein NS220_14285 [Microbacterium testaceum]|uniref:Uncharacterized protein n=1 Tax=Microbacterium testaceum TaxID=2033 RepID=A0A147EUE5_MICTE|nr:hypothetical protein [Microbacterium testaceum]KTR92603.1 hypothetical protein NS220_14285 [Microbacterium testaceum]